MTEHLRLESLIIMITFTLLRLSLCLEIT